MWKALLVIIALLGASSPAPASACDCSSETAAIPAKSAQLGVWGRATRVVQAQTGHLVRFEVFDIGYDEKNKSPKNIVLQDPTYCGVDFEEGETYWVRGLELRQENLYLTNSCAGSRRIATPPDTIEHVAPKLKPFESGQRVAIEKAANAAAQTCKEELGTKRFESFMFGLTPGDDPLIMEIPSVLEKRAGKCVAEAMLANLATLVPEQPLVVTGSVLAADKPRGVIDVWACEGCDAFSSRLTARLVEVAPPLTEKQARVLAKQMHHVTDRDPSVEIARTLCRLDGVEAAEKFARNNKLVGGPRWTAEFHAMLFECSIATRKFEAARTLLQTTNPGPAFSTAFTWLMATEDHELPIRKDRPTLQTTVDGPLRDVRQAFVNTELWENDPVILEAFAESVAGDPDAPAAVRRVGALAYHKAALLHPDAAEAYVGFARELVPDAEISEALEKMKANYETARDVNEARASLAERTAAEAVEQLDLDAPQTNQANTRRGPILKDDPKDREMDLDWGSLALHLLVVVGSLSLIAFVASRGSRRR